MDQITSLKNLAVLRLAVDISLRPDVLRKMMQDYAVFPCVTLDFWTNVYLTLKAEVHRVDIPLNLLEELLSHAMAIAFRVMNLIKHHVNEFHLTEAKLIGCLDSSFFTSGGLIDYQKLGRKLVEDEHLNGMVKYKISCFYFLEGGVLDSKRHIRNLISCSVWQVLLRKSRRSLLHGKQAGLPRIISERFNRASTDKRFSVRRTINILKAAVESGSMLAVKYCWENLEWSNRSNFLVRTCLSVMALIDVNVVNEDMYERSNRNYEQVLAPSDFYLDILSFLVSRMNDNVKEQFFRKDFAKYERVRSLTLFLRWPHQKGFIDLYELVKTFLPEVDFSYLIPVIVRKFEPKFLKTTETSFSNTCIEDYRKILREFWLKSDDKLKRHFFSSMKLQKMVLTEIMELQNFSDLDRQNFTTIVEDATPEEKEKFFNKCGLAICKAAVFRERFHLASWFLETCCTNRDALITFTRRFLSPRALESTFVYLVQQLKFANYLLKECFNTEEEKAFFIMSPLYSSQQSIVFNIISKDWKAFEFFVGLCLDTEEKFLAFKEFFWMNHFSEVFYFRIINSRLHEVELFLSWIVSEEREIVLYKRYVLFPIFGIRIITFFIQGGLFQEADNFLHWFRSSEREVRELKNELILNHQGFTDTLIQLLRVNYKTIEYSQQNNQEEEEVEEEEEEDEDEDLNEVEEMYYSDGDSNEDENSEIEDGNDLKGHPYDCIERCGGRVEAVQLILRLFLTDQLTTLTYRKQFHEKYQSCLMEDRLAKSEGLAIFDNVVQEHLQYLASQENIIDH